MCQFKPYDHEFSDICTDLVILFDQAQSLRQRMESADANELKELQAKMALIASHIVEGTTYLQEEFFHLDCFLDYHPSVKGEKAAKNLTIEQAMEEEGFQFFSQSMRLFGEWWASDENK